MSCVIKARLYFIILTYVIIAFVQSNNGNEAIANFIRHKQVKSERITVLQNSEHENTSWIEYQYRFDNKIRVNLTGVELRIAVLPNNDTSFDCRVKNNIANGNVSYNGYSIEIVELLQKSLNFRVSYQLISPTTSTKNSITTLLNSNKIDLLICHRELPYKSTEILQLYNTFKSSYAIIYKAGKVHMSKDIFILTFVGSLWLVFLATLAILAICLRITTYYYSQLDGTQYAWNWVEITLWAIAAACQQGLSHCPDRFASRCIFFIGYLTSYLLYTGFAAGITSILVQEDLNKLDESFLKKDNIKVVVYGNLDEFPRHLKPKSSITQYFDEMSTFFNALDSSNTIGLAPEVYLGQHLTKHFDSSTSKDFIISKIPGVKIRRGFLVNLKSVWKNEINRGLMKLHQYGVLDNLLQRKLLPVIVPEVDSAYSSAGQEHVGSAILLFLGGVLGAILCLLMEFLLASYRNYQHKFRMP